MDCLEAAAICACICFQSAGGKLIAFETFVIKALYKCTTLLLKISPVPLRAKGLIVLEKVIIKLANAS